MGRTGRPVSIIGLGTWPLGGDSGDVAEAEALAVLDAAVQAGVALIDAADVLAMVAASSGWANSFARTRATTCSCDQNGRRAPLAADNYHVRELRLGRTGLVAMLGVERWTWCSYTVRPPRCILAAGVRRARRPGFRTTDRGVWGECGNRRRGSPAIAHGVASVQIISTPSTETAGESAARGRRGRRRHPGPRTAASGLLSGRSPTTRSSPATTTVPTTGTARPSTSEKRQRVDFIPGSRPRGNSPRSLHAAYRLRNWRCAGWLTGQASQQLSPAPVPRSGSRQCPVMGSVRLTQLFNKVCRALRSTYSTSCAHTLVACTPAPNQDWLLPPAKRLQRTWPQAHPRLTPCLAYPSGSSYGLSVRMPTWWALSDHQKCGPRSVGCGHNVSCSASSTRVLLRSPHRPSCADAARRPTQNRAAPCYVPSA